LIKDGNVLIIGGGISGITVALELSALGIPITLIEKETYIGGLAGKFCCKASESCNKCFACVVDKRIIEIHQNKNITLLTQTELIHTKKNEEFYEVILKSGEKKINLKASAIVIAAGIDPYNATQKAEYGYGNFRNVITAKDLDEMLRYTGKLTRPSDGRLPKAIAFFQCVGSRDESIGNLYCSQVCCSYALRLIKALRYQYSQVLITFLYMDIQPSGTSFQQFLKSCREDHGIRLIRGLPSKVYHSPISENLRVRFIDPQRGEVVEETFELIVLSVGMVLSQGAKRLSQLFDLNYNEDGFIIPPPAKNGIFVAGACSGPKDIDRSILHAKSTAFEVYQYLKGIR